jgi:two-component system, LytTR family, sensor kinase
MILQPLVENSIRHGIANLENGGQIEISAQRQNGTLLLEVRDNGAGFAEKNGFVYEGIGLPNTRARLKHLYGEAHKFSFENLPEGGVSVGLGIPFKEYIEKN